MFRARAHEPLEVLFLPRRKAQLQCALGAPRAPPPPPLGMVREARYETTYPVTAKEYYDMMLCSSFQRRVHVEGLRMLRWDNVDVFGPNRELSRRIYSEPNLRVPKFLAKFARKSQAYHEESEFDPKALTRRTRVIPCIGSHIMDFNVGERYVDVPKTSSCIVISTVTIRVKTRLFRKLLERWILEQSQTKVAQRDAYVLDALRNKSFSEIVSAVDDDVDKGGFGELGGDDAVTIEERIGFVMGMLALLGGVAFGAKRRMTRIRS